MARSLLLFLTFLFTITPLVAQTFRFEPHAFGPNMAAGGIDQPRFQFTDIDGDSDQDLFILDRDERLMFYRAVNGTYLLESRSDFGLSAGAWFRFTDIDNDGDQDFFTSGPFSEVSFYTNIGSPVSPQFQLTAAAVKDTSGIPLFSERFSVPAFADIDADGDDDLFSGSQSGSITFFRNVGTPAASAFAFITDKFNGIEIIGGGGTLPKAMHGASGIEFFDADSNGTLDLFWGDYFNRSLYFLKNTGTASAPNIILVDSTFPDEAVIFTNGFNIPQHTDIDRDGLTDLMVGSVFPTSEIDNFHFYRNAGSNQEPFYLLETKNFVPMIDAGSRSAITTADVDGDGDQDMIIGSAGGTVTVHRNTGSTSVPAFTVQPDATFSLAGDFYLTVTAGDINADGKPDLLCGNFNGRLKAFVNTGSGSTISFAPFTYTLDAYDAGQNSAPCFADPDRDGDNDLFIGSSGGTVILLRNNGTNAVPVFESDAAFTLPDLGSDAIPSVTDLDKDGLDDLIIGTSEGILHHYEQISSGALTFILRSNSMGIPPINTQAAPSFADMDSDGDPDLLLGNGKGGVMYHRNDLTVSVGTHNKTYPVSLQLSNPYPNPFNPSTSVAVRLQEEAKIHIMVIDIAGRTVATLADGVMSSGEHRFRWDATNAASGAYLVTCVARFRHGTVTEYRRLSLIK